MSSGRFAMAVHALALLAQSEGGASSEYLAASVNTHAVFLRRVLRDLAREGLIVAREGRGGGYALARPAARISLADVYRAVEPHGPLAASPAEPNPRCPIGSGMPAVFASIAARARRGLERALHEQTVADVAKHARRAGCAARA